MVGCSSDSSGDPSTSAAAVTTAGAGADASTTVSQVTAAEATTVAPSTDPPSTASSTAAPSTAATTTGPTTTTTPPTTIPPTTTFPLLVQGGVVLVANASGIDGAAAALSTTLADLGFQTVKATNSAGYESKLDVSKVYFTGDGYPAAYSIAQLMGGIEVAAMPTPPPISNALEGLRGANVIVMLGADRAAKPVPGQSG